MQVHSKHSLYVLKLIPIVVHEAFWIHLVVVQALVNRLDHLLELVMPDLSSCTSTNNLKQRVKMIRSEERLTKLSNSS